MMGLPLDSLLGLFGSVVLAQIPVNELLSNPWFYAAVSALALWVGGAIGDWVQPDQRWEAGLLAVGGGALIVAMAFELYEPAVENIGKWGASFSFLVGVITFGGLDILIHRLTSVESTERGLGLWASITIDGIAENLAMGSVLTGSVHGALAILFALVMTNGSQSMMSATNMREKHGAGLTIAAWFVTGVVIGGAVIVGYRVLPSFPEYWVDAIRAFAGGVILASLAGEIFPDAYQEAGPIITFMTAAGFLVTFLLL